MNTDKTNIRPSEIIEWVYNNFTGNYSIKVNTDNEIIINGNISLKNKEIEELPYKFKEVIGDFILGCYHPVGSMSNYFCSNIKSLKNCPDIVHGNFSCRGCNKLESLLGGPSVVHGYYLVSNDSLHDLTGIAKEIGKGIHVYNNHELVDISALNEVKDFTYVDCEFCNENLKDTSTYKKLKNLLKIKE